MAKLKGTYYINPNNAASASNYQNFASAIGDLLSGTRTDGGTPNGKGVKGPVTFRIANGTYHEQIYLTHIPGTSDTSRVIFQSDTEDCRFVTIDIPSANGDTGKVVSSNYAISLNGASYVTFQLLTIKRSGSGPFANVINLLKDTSIGFSNNFIVGTKISSLNQYHFQSECFQQYQSIKTSIIKNTFKNGRYGIDINGTGTTSDYGHVIAMNIFDSCIDIAISCVSSGNCSINKNTITNVIDNEGAGIYIGSSSDTVAVSANTLILARPWYGISVSSGVYSQVYNNVIVMGVNKVPTLCYGIYMSGCNYSSTVFNSVNILSPAPTATAAYISSISNSVFYNNILSNSGGGLALQTSGTNKTISNNNLYTVGANLVQTSSGRYATLKKYQTACSCDAGSLSLNPYFYSATDLHCINTYLAITGFNVFFVKSDHDGVNRSMTNSCIGAYNVSLKKEDVAFIGIKSPDVHFCSGKFPVMVDLFNAGWDTLRKDSLLYSINGGTPKLLKFKGKLPWAVDTILTLGTDSLASGQNYLYKIWSTGPNDTVDMTRANDTITRMVYEGLKGAYTIGGSNPDYATINAAVTDLQYRGVCGPVTFKIRDGVYAEQVTIAPIPNVSKSSNVVFTSESGDSSKVIITWQSYSDTTQNYTLGIFGASYITFQKLHFERAGSQAYNNVVFMAGGAYNISFLNNQIIGTKILSNPVNAPICKLVLFDRSIDSNIAFIQNYLRYGIQGIYMIGSDSLHPSFNNSFQNNIFDSVLDQAIQISSNNNVSITGNTFKYMTSFGIGIDYCPAFNISGNRFQMPAAHGIDIGDCRSTATKPALISNNFMLMTGLSSNTGIYCYGRNINIINNTIVVQHPQSSACISIFQFSNKAGLFYGVNILNNILVSLGGQVFGYDTTAIGTVDNNDLFTTGTSIGTGSSKTYNKLSNWQSTKKWDVHGLSVDPWFKSVTDLHVSSPLLYKKGKYFSSVPIDIDGQTRNTTAPVIGADEFVAYPSDAGITGFNPKDSVFCAANLPLIAVLTNFGTDTLKKVSVDWMMNNTLQTTANWTGALAPGTRINDTLGFFNLQSRVNYLKQAWSKNPNGTTDGNFTNDTSLITPMIEGLHGTYTIGGTNPDYKTFTDASRALQLRGVCGPVVFNVRNGTYYEQVFLNYVLNSSTTNNITFQSESGDSSKVILTFSSDVSTPYNCALQLYNAAYYTIKGITIQKTGSNNGYGSALVFAASCWANNILNNRIVTLVPPGDDRSSCMNTIYSNDSNNLIQNNYFYGGGGGIFVDALSQSKNNHYLYNTFDSSRGAMYFANCDNAIITGNIMHPLATFGGIGVSTTGSNHIIISKNKIFTRSATGIDIARAVGKRINPSQIIDNYIYSTGIDNHPIVTEMSFIDVMYNTIRCTNYTYNNYLISIYNDSNKSIRFMNNCIVNEGPSTIFYYGSAASLGQWNYNSYYNKGYYFAGLNVSNQILDFNAWKNAFHVDSNSVYSYPIFTDNDGHTHSAILDGKAKVNYVTNDYENNVRSSTKPDIGAYEFTPYGNDYAITSLISPANNDCGDSNLYFRIACINNGSNTQTKVPVVIKISGSINTTLYDTLKTSIAPGSNDTFWLKPSINAYAGGIISVKVYCNLTADQDRTNDTVYFNNIHLNPNTTSPTVKGAIFCHTNSVKLYATGQTGDSLRWYASATSNKPVGYGDSLKTPTLSGSKTYYVQSRAAQKKYYAGAISDTVGHQYSGSSRSLGLYFDVLADISIDSVTVYPTTSGKVIVSVLDHNNNLVAIDTEQANVSVSGKAVQIPVFLRVPRGTDYFITANGTTITLWGDDQFDKYFPGYPIIVPNVLSIKRTESPGTYNFFYHWVVSTIGCGSARVPVNAVFTSGLKNAAFSKGANFSGKYNAGTLANPHNICSGLTSEFAINPATGLGNSSYGTNWKINFTIKTVKGTLFKDTSFVKPGASNGILKITPKSLGDSTILVSCQISNLTTGCDTTIQMYIFINPVPQSGFTYALNCLGRNTVFTNTTIGIGDTYSWNFGDTTYSAATSPSHIFARTNTYSVKLVATNTAGCADSTTKSITIYPKPVAAFGTVASCPGSTVLFYDSSKISSGTLSTYSWNFGDNNGSTANGSTTHKYTNGGNYTAKLIITSNNGCTDTTKRTVVIYPTPFIAFTYSAVCDGQAVAFTNKSTISSGTMTYKWKFGDGGTSTSTNPSYTYKTSGTFTVYLVVTTSNGCKDSNSTPETIYPKPVAGFSESSTCASTTATFTNSSKISSGTMTYAWDFGDLANSTTQNPTHPYSSNGTYLVKLKVTSNNSCTDTVSKSITLFPHPVAAFIVNSTPQCLNGNSFTFTDKSTVASGGTLSSWAWDFGDGNTSTTQSPTYAYTKTGSFRVKLKITASNGCTDTISKSITVKPQSIPLFKVSQIAECLLNNSFTFTDKSSVSTGSISSWAWDFGDLTSSISQNPTHAYTNAGSFKILLKTTNSYGCTDTISKSVIVNPQSTPSFNVSQFSECLLNNSFTFTDKSSVSTGSISSWVWDFGDLTSSSSQNPTHVYTSAGAFKILLKTTNSNGCTDTVSKSITVNPTPSALFAISSHNECLSGNNFVFTDKSALSAGSITAWAWDFGDLTSSTSQNPTHTYSSPGNYHISLTVTSALGCRVTYTDSVQVNGSPTAAFSSKNGCENDSFVFTDASNISFGTINSYTWDFGDRGSSPVQNPVHRYTVAGTYIAKLIIASNHGCTDSVSNSIVVFPIPTAAFSTGNTCDYDSAVFIDKSIIKSGDLSYLWTFGDSTSSLMLQPMHRYSLSGNYTATLKVTSLNGCVDTVSHKVQIFEHPTAKFDLVNGCQKDSLLFRNISSIGEGSLSSQWNFGDSTASTINSPSHFYKTNGTFDVKLVVKSLSGCYDSISQKTTVYPNPTAGFSFTGICTGDSTKFVSATRIDSGTLFYNWDFGDGSTSSTESPSHLYAKTGSNNVKLTVGSDHGCLDSMIRNLEILPRPNVSFAASKVCLGTATTFRDSSVSKDSLLSYYWKFGDGNTDIVKNPVHIYNDTGAYHVQETVTSSSGCVGILNKEINVIGKPNAKWTFIDTDYSVAFTPDDSTLRSYAWNFGDTSVSNVGKPIHTFARNGSYNVKLIVNNGTCPDSMSQTINIHVHTSAIHDNSAFYDLNVFPNPFHEELTIEYGLTRSTNVKIEVTDITGRVVKFLDLGSQFEGEHLISVDFGKNFISPGMYSLRMIESQGVTMRSVLKLK